MDASFLEPFLRRLCEVSSCISSIYFSHSLYDALAFLCASKGDISVNFVSRERSLEFGFSYSRLVAAR